MMLIPLKNELKWCILVCLEFFTYESHSYGRKRDKVLSLNSFSLGPKGRLRNIVEQELPTNSL